MTVFERHLSVAPRRWRLDAERSFQAHERVYRRVGLRDLATIRDTFQGSPREIGRLFAITRQALQQWADRGVPPGRLADVGRVADVARRLRRTIKRERIPEIVRRPNPGLNGESVMDALAAPDGAKRVSAALDRLTSYVPAP